MEKNLAGFRVGQAVRCKVDDRFLTGTDRFQDEIIRFGQLLSGSFMDCAIPRTKGLPSFDTAVGGEILCYTNALGIKGTGEAGTVGALAPAMNALMDALAPLGVTHVDTPATPNNVWRATQVAKARLES